MSALSSQHARIRPGFAIGIVLVAVGAWGFVLFTQFRKSPAQRHVEAGNAYAHEGKNLQAVKEWETAVQLDPKNAYAWQVLGQSYFAAGKWRRAIEDFIHLQHLHPETPRINSLLASCFFHIGDQASALKYAEEELKRNPDDIPALETSAAIQTRLGNEAEQVRCLKRLTDLLPTNRDHLIALAEVVINDHNFTEGRSLAERILKLDPDNAAAYAMHGICLFFTDGSPQGMAQAEQDLLHSLSYKPDTYFSHLYLGRIYRRQGRMEKALAHLEEAVRLRPEKADSYFDLANAYERVGKPEQAAGARQKFQTLSQEAEQLLHLKKQCELNPENFDLNLKVGLLTLRQGDMAAATRYLQRAKALRPNDSTVQSALQQLETLRGKASFPNLPSSGAASAVPNSPGTGGS